MLFILFLLLANIISFAFYDKLGVWNIVADIVGIAIINLIKIRI